MPYIIFQSTSPSREATLAAEARRAAASISIHVSLAGGDKAPVTGWTEVDISIHVSLAGGDPHRLAPSRVPHRISIHVSLAGGDVRSGSPLLCCCYFNPRLPRGRRLHPGAAERNCPAISIHVSLAGGDFPLLSPFPPRRPISIHVSLAGGDCTSAVAG